MSRIRRLTTCSALVALLLHSQISAAQDLPPRPPPPGSTQPPQSPPAAVGEEATKPSGAFFPTLGHNLVDDLKHIPRLNTVYWLAAGTGLALAVHPADDNINDHFLNSSSSGFFIAGKVIGSTPFILGSAFTAYGLGRWKKHPRLEHLGMDEIEGALLTEGIVEGGKQIARRDRPLNPDGTKQAGFSFPSGHAAMTFDAATILQQHLGYKAGIPTYLIATYVAMSRLHDNRHFASDVAFGAAVGIIIGRSVTWHGRNFYGYPSVGKNSAEIVFAMK